MAEYHGHRCWVITDDVRKAAQARRLDGEPFQLEDSTPKALTLPGSYGTWLVGTAALGQCHKSILLVEGGPDLLAAHQFILQEGRQNDAAAVAMLGSGGAIWNDTLAAFQGRKVRIAEHTDKAGRVAGARWAAQLRPYAKHIDRIDMIGLRKVDGNSVKDLNDLAHVSTADAKIHKWIGQLVP